MKYTLPFRSLKKPSNSKSTREPQLPFWNTKLLPTTQGSHSRRWLRPFNTFYEGQIFAVQHVHCIVDTIKAHHSENTWENGSSPPAHETAQYYYTLIESFQFLLHTHLCMFVRFGGFSPFLSFKKMSDWENEMSLFIRLQSMKNYSRAEVKCEKGQVTSSGPFQTGFCMNPTGEAPLEQPRATTAWASSLVFLMDLWYWSPVLN